MSPGRTGTWLVAGVGFEPTTFRYEPDLCGPQLLDLTQFTACLVPLVCRARQFTNKDNPEQLGRGPELQLPRDKAPPQLNR